MEEPVVEVEAVEERDLEVVEEVVVQEGSYANFSSLQ